MDRSVTASEFEHLPHTDTYPRTYGCPNEPCSLLSERALLSGPHILTLAVNVSPSARSVRIPSLAKASLIT